MHTAVSDGVRERYFIAGPRVGARYLLELLTAVEINDLHILEFLVVFRTGLRDSQAVVPSSGWTLLKWVLASLERIFHDCADPAEAVMLEARHADRITLHFELMRSILRAKGNV